MFGIKVIKKHTLAFVGGFVDRFASRVTHKNICIGKALLVKIGECEPWTDHIDSSVFSQVNKALKDKDFGSARSLVQFGTMINESNKSNNFCVSFCLEAINLAAKGEETLIEAIPFYYMD
jgi:hypothetical protein